MSISKNEIKKELKEGVRLIMPLCPLDDFLNQEEALFLYRIFRESPGDWDDYPKEEFRDKIVDDVKLEDMVFTDLLETEPSLTEDDIVNAIKSLTQKGLVELSEGELWIHWEKIFLLRFKTLNHKYNYF